MIDLQLNLNNKLLETVKLRNSVCPNCKSKENLEYSVYGGVLRVFLIPVAPARRIIKLFCTNCQKDFKLKDVSYEIKQAVKYERGKTKTETPLWQFTGSFIIVLLLSLGIYTGFKMSKLEKVYISKPKKDDIYKVNIDGNYTTLKVFEVTNDSVTVLLNRYTLNGRNAYQGIDKINIDENYTSTKGFSKKGLQQLYNENSIYEIIREE